jgi:hypothetical protein
VNRSTCSLAVVLPGAIGAQLVDVGRLGRPAGALTALRRRMSWCTMLGPNEDIYSLYPRWFLTSSPPNYGVSAPSNVAATAPPTLSVIPSGIGAGACTAV